ncbi:hypothetical protein ABNQ39_11530 [Azospirillum sp. A26]|uniref:hypothetical protein n=1 Tax=Azospirillum sp. A26 TaxID=3160607 RepID=UPI00366C4A81
MFGLLSLAATYLIPLLGDAVGSLFSDDAQPAAKAVTTAVAQAAIDTAAKATGITITDEASMQQAAQALQADPTKLADYQRALTERALGEMAEVTKRLSLDNDDRASARAHDLAYLTTGRRNSRPDVLIGIAVVGVVACVLTLVLGKVDGNTAVGGFIIGVGMLLAGKIGTAFDFEFGSSAGSQAKDDALQQRGGMGLALGRTFEKVKGVAR